MPQRSKDPERELSSDAARAAEEQSLGTLVDTLPLQRLGLVRFKDTGHVVHRFELGLVDAPAGAAPVALPYDRIDWVCQSYLRQYLNHVYRQTSFWFTVSSMDREILKWNGGFAEEGPRRGTDPRLPEFAKRLTEQVAAARLPAHRKALADGKVLKFGNVVFSQRGLHMPDGVVPWPQLASPAVDRGEVALGSIGQRRPLARVRLGSIPNLPMFFTLYDDLRRGRSSRPS